MASGTLIFSGIHQVPDNWWNDPPASDPASVWKVWDKNTYYAGDYFLIASSSLMKLRLRLYSTRTATK